jgi:hypothetical protein
MNKAKQTPNDDLRKEYKLSDFPKPFMRGKYADRTDPSHGTDTNPDSEKLRR